MVPGRARSILRLHYLDMDEFHEWLAARHTATTLNNVVSLS